MAPPPESRHPDSGSDWDLVLRHLEFSEGFSLSFLAITDRYAEKEITEKLRGWLAARSRKLISKSFETPEELTSLASWLVELESGDSSAVIFASAAVPEGLPEGPLWRAAWEQALSWLNQYRNLIQQRHRCSVILAGPDYLPVVARENAPDLWSVRAISAVVQPPEGTASADLEIRLPGSVYIGLGIDPTFAVGEARRLLARKGSDARAALFFDRAALGFAARNLRQKALDASEAAVSIYRRLASSQQEKHLPGLAMTLNTLANCQSEMGWREKALETAEEAVRLRRELVAMNRDAFLPDLAMSQNNLAGLQSDMGKWHQALITAEEAVQNYRELAAKRPAGSVPNLAAALSNLANRQSELGRREEALKTAAEAVGLYRELVAKNRDAFLPNLAMSMNNLVGLQNEVGRREEALQTAEETVELYGELAGKNRDAFLPELAGSLNNLANSQSAVGRPEEALKTAEKALEHYRDLAGKNRAAFLPRLAASLSNLASFQRVLGWREEALTTAAEAVELYRELVKINHDAFAAELARSCVPLGMAFTSLERHDEAADTFAEGVKIILPYTRDYSGALRELTTILLSLYLHAVERTGKKADERLMKEAARALGLHKMQEGDAQP